MWDNIGNLLLIWKHYSIQQKIKLNVKLFWFYKVSNLPTTSWYRSDWQTLKQFKGGLCTLAGVRIVLLWQFRYYVTTSNILVGVNINLFICFLAGMYFLTLYGTKSK